MTRKFVLLVLGVLLTNFAFAQISINEYVDRVVEYSHEIQSAEAKIEGASAEYRIAQLGRFPKLSLSTDAPLKGIQSNLVQPIYNGGRLNARIRQQELALIESESGLDRTILDTRYEAELAYWSLSRAEIYRQAMCDYIAIVQSLRSVAQHRFEEGYTSKSDLLQVESRLSDAEYQLSEAEQRWRVALYHFNILRGEAANAVVALSDDIFNSSPMPERIDMTTILTHHPDYVIALVGRESAQCGIALRKADYLPTVGAGIFGQWPFTSKGVATGGVVISVNVPIFHFMERRDAIRSAKSSYTSSEAQVAEVVDNILLNENSGWTNLEYSYRRVEAVQRNLDIARENLDISTYSYREGGTTILDVLQAQLSWLQIYENAITAEYDYAVAIASYRYIIGGLDSTSALGQHE